MDLPLLGTVLLSALVVSFGCASSAAVGAPATPIGAGSVLTGVREGSGPLPAGCRPDEVLRFLTRFLDAYTRGDQATIADSFPDERGSANDPDNPGFQWYSVGGGDERFVAYDPGDLPAYFAARHARHERLRLIRLEIATSWHPGVDIVFDLDRVADDFPARTVGGKGAIDCSAQQIIVWSVGDAEVLVDPTSQPHASPGA